MSETTDDGRCERCGGGFFKQRPKGAQGPREVWQPCICAGILDQLQRSPSSRAPSAERSQSDA